MKNKFPHIKQHDAMDCGPACLAMVAQYYGKIYTLQGLRENIMVWLFQTEKVT